MHFAQALTSLSSTLCQPISLEIASGGQYSTMQQNNTLSFLDARPKLKEILQHKRLSSMNQDYSQFSFQGARAPNESAFTLPQGVHSRNLTMGQNTANSFTSASGDIKSQIKKLKPMQVIELKKAILEIDAEKEISTRYTI